jgi:hypothetical protein
MGTTCGVRRDVLESVCPEPGISVGWGVNHDTEAEAEAGVQEDMNAN